MKKARKKMRSLGYFAKGAFAVSKKDLSPAKLRQLQGLLKNRRKRRFSEREVMRIKRKLKKSARKLRLGAKRTGAYVYGTLRRIVGNPMRTHNEKGQRLYVVITSDGKPLSGRVGTLEPPGPILYTKGDAIKKARVFKGRVLSVIDYNKYQRDTRRGAIRRGYMPKEYLSEAERRLVGNPGGRYRVGGGYKTFTMDEAKREAERIFRTTGNIVSIEEHRPTPQVAPAWKYGIYTGRGVVRKNPATKARPIPGKFYRVYWSHPSRGETGQITFTGDQLLKIKSVTELSRYWPIKEGLKMAKVHFRGPYDSWDDAFMDR